MKSISHQGAIFLDRDGVIIENRPDYVRSLPDVRFIPRVIQALRMASASSYKILIITNQSAIGRGIINLTTAEEINHRVVDTIRVAGGRIDGLLMCPHAPEDDCKCRKPRPGLLFKAADMYSIKLEDSVIIGDALSDLQAGEAAGIPNRFLVSTGRGRQQALLAASLGDHPLIWPDLFSVLNDWLKEGPRGLRSWDRVEGS